MKLLKTHINRYVLACFIIVFLFFAAAPFVLFSHFHSSIQINACLEIASSLIAYMAALACIVYYLSSNNRFFLIISLGFFICATVNLVHGSLVYYELTKATTLYSWSIIHGTYISGRWSILAIMIITAVMLEHTTNKKESLARREAVLFSILVVIVSGTAATLAFFTPLPDFIYPNRLISRPVDFLSTIIFAIAFLLIAKRFHHYKDVFSGTLLAYILLNVFGHLCLSFSKQLFDSSFEVANWANILSYCFPVLGITLETLNKNKIIQEEIIIREDVEKKVRTLNSKLEMLVEERTKELEKSLKTLKNTQRQLIQSEKLNSLGLLSAGIAHEINNPISFIMSNIKTIDEYAQILKKILDRYIALETGIAPSRQTKKIKLLLQNIQEIKSEEDMNYILNDIDNLISETYQGTIRIKDIVNNLRTFAYVDATPKQKTNVNHEIETALKIAHNELKYKCNVYKKFGNIPLILCYPTELNQVFLNLIVNAAQAIKEKGDITIETKVKDNNVIIKITDTGIGISKKSLNKIFDPFFTAKQAGKGTGLGLYVSHGIVEKHNGTINVNSKPGKGTSFTIKLPIVS